MLFRVLGSELLACLKASNRLVLCAVVHKCTLDVGHKGYACKIAEEDAYLNNALNERVYKAVHLGVKECSQKPVDSVADPVGKQDKEQSRETETEDERNHHNNVGKLSANLLGEPLFEL